MTIFAVVAVLCSPFALTAALSWLARRDDVLRLELDQFRAAAPLGGMFAED